MSAFDASTVRAAYDTVARDYARAFGNDLLALPLDRQVLDEFVERIASSVSVLDIGCGPGQVGRYLEERGLRVIGMDLSQQMMLAAPSHLTDTGRFVCGDMRTIPFQSGSFSGAIAFYSVQHLPRDSLESVLTEIHRVLQPCGSFVLATHLGEGSVYSSEFLGHNIATVGGTLYNDDELLEVLDCQSFMVHNVRYRDPLAHELDTQRIYLGCTRSDKDR